MVPVVKATAPLPSVPASCRKSCARCRTTTEVSLILEDKRLQVRGGKSRFSLQTLPADDFPRMTMSEGETKQFQISQKGLSPTAGQDPVQPWPRRTSVITLNGLLLLVEGKELRAVATDGHRLAFASVEIEAELPRQEMILPRKTVLELNRLLVDSEEPLQHHAGRESGALRLRFGGAGFQVDRWQVPGLRARGSGNAEESHDRWSADP